MKLLLKNLIVLALIFGSCSVFSQNKRSLNNFREPSKEGINVFESPKDTAVVKAFDGVQVRIGASSALQFQALNHENGWVESTDPTSPWFETMPLIEIGDNFNLATANLDLDVALADGLRMHLRTYLSSRHHPEPYVKGGYMQIDNLNFIKEGTLSELMKYVTIKVGHMENNYGDQHFRRSDNSSALYNPFVGNTILDAFTTEVGGEVYFRKNGWLAMVGLSNGKLNQAVTKPETTSPSFLGKVGYDKQINSDLRFRLTGSIYNSTQSSRVYLYSADRAGSRYYLVLEDAEANAKNNFRSGRFDPGFTNEVRAIMINPFVKYKGLEVFGLVELTSGRSDAEFEDGTSFTPKNRDWTQFMAEVLYRFGNNENFYIGGRYNSASGELAGSGLDVTIDRINIGGGVFLTKNVLAKLEYVSQTYDGFSEGSNFNEGKFSGVMFESVISF